MELYIEDTNTTSNVQFSNKDLKLKILTTPSP